MKIREKINDLKPKINTNISPTAMELIGILELVRKSLETEKMVRDKIKEMEDNKPILEEQRIIEQYKVLDPAADLRYKVRHIEGWTKDTEELDKKNQKRMKKILSNVGKGVANGFRKK